MARTVLRGQKKSYVIYDDQTKKFLKAGGRQWVDTFKEATKMTYDQADKWENRARTLSIKSYHIDHFKEVEEGE